MNRWTYAEWSVLDRRLRHLLTLPDGWDGPGSIGVTLRGLHTALDILWLTEQRGLEAPQISPTGMGGLNITWGASRPALELEAMPDGTVEYLYVDIDDVDHEGAVSTPVHAYIQTVASAYLAKLALPTDWSL